MHTHTHTYTHAHTRTHTHTHTHTHTQCSTAMIAETVDLLLELKEPPNDLCQQFLAKLVASLSP